jgi:hypothetical protein
VEVPFNREEEARLEKRRALEAIVRRSLAEAYANRTGIPGRTVRQTPKTPARPWLKPIKYALMIPLLILIYYGFKILLLIIIALENIV